ncbi:MAG: DUF2254 domain-containing protein [Alphaproteobacteria bacterium]|nr:DUF2254 domain-containing protein [Alphaproteobacteria bacterium]
MMCAVAVGMSFLLIEVDTLLGVGTVTDFGLLYTFGPEGARAILSVIASSMITVASLIFSITMLSLQLASSQFGPRVLENFMRDRSNQIVLGTFVATFLYCLVVLRAVRGTADSSFVPHLTVAFAVVLAAVGVAVLIYFIHHIATSIRIETLLAQLADDGCIAVDRLFPERPWPLPGARQGQAISKDATHRPIAVIGAFMDRRRQLQERPKQIECVICIERDNVRLDHAEQTGEVFDQRLLLPPVHERR